MGMKTKLDNNISTSGPYTEYSSPYGRTTLARDCWFISRALSKEERKTSCQKITGYKSLGMIVRFKSNKRRFVISHLFPAKAFSSLRKATDFLVKSEDKIVFCS
jgi:hypothetical protein